MVVVVGLYSQGDIMCFNCAADTLWVEKYKPRTAIELVGNQTNVATVRQWLHQWEQVHLKGATPVQPKTGGYGVSCKYISRGVSGAVAMRAL